jgi:hypothetical protein
VRRPGPHHRGRVRAPVRVGVGGSAGPIVKAGQERQATLERPGPGRGHGHEAGQESVVGGFPFATGRVACRSRELG